ncbi:trimeric intracellular cation channel family protein [Massilia cellulosiltytica]|uniref:trimeric intracellular cation channel family protein n=1 Tax=Massilia cellulosiltytica TaxID=2683234 RepID=UPI0039B56FF9
MFSPVSLDVSAAIKTLVLTLDLLGTFVFALSGAVAGVRRRLDLFGVLVLSFVAANSGGIVRDVLIGATPPSAIRDWRYLAVSLLAGVLIFFWYPRIKRLQSPVLIFDAAGLALFCVAGAQKALVFGLDPVMAALLGMLTGVGGGVARDVLLSEIPAVLRSDIYAVAALAGAAVMVTGDALGVPGTVSACAGAALCFGLRLAAIKLDWHLPVAHASLKAAADAAKAEGRNER